ncbi:hypothetical protein HPP92_014412 [Vanilla planifolia]|uniref:Uncharacterized protein n=1 Tax=Vanilla planifolia TaxID=51239 RepID=A0A835UT28_VANPL|nr:hypothetical protein HPP92_014814 [Vanilla planifolia]KAG0474726.1 hypothetical protein HPP92_014412 [Vanilla planifolia]
MGRAPCCDKASVKKGPWSPEEDNKLKDYIENHGIGGNWIALPQKAGLRRCGKSCRLRWLNYLRPNLKHGNFSVDEDRVICNLFANIGSRWSIIASHLPGRTDNDIKNYWNTKLKKKLFGKQKDEPLPYSLESPNGFPNPLMLHQPNFPSMFSSSSSPPLVPIWPSQEHQSRPNGSNLLIFGGGQKNCGSCEISFGGGGGGGMELPSGEYYGSLLGGVLGGEEQVLNHNSGCTGFCFEEPREVRGISFWNQERVLHYG